MISLADPMTPAAERMGTNHRSVFLPIFGSNDARSGADGNTTHPAESTTCRSNDARSGADGNLRR